MPLLTKVTLTTHLTLCQQCGRERLCLHAEVLQATASEGLAQGPYVAARAGFEPVRIRMQAPNLTLSHYSPHHCCLSVYLILKCHRIDDKCQSKVVSRKIIVRKLSQISQIFVVHMLMSVWCNSCCTLLCRRVDVTAACTEVTTSPCSSGSFWVSAAVSWYTICLL